MSERTVYICDGCDTESPDEVGAGWQQNTDGEDFCAACSTKLDPPEDQNHV